jgi:hypothetical protein
LKPRVVAMARHDASWLNAHETTSAGDEGAAAAPEEEVIAPRARLGATRSLTKASRCGASFIKQSPRIDKTPARI